MAQWSQEFVKPKISAKEKKNCYESFHSLFEKLINLISYFPLQNIAKNIIVFVGSGMSQATVTAARTHKGGENATFAFEKLKWSGNARVSQMSLLSENLLLHHAFDLLLLLLSPLMTTAVCGMSIFTLLAIGTKWGGKGCFYAVIDTNCFPSGLTPRDLGVSLLSRHSVSAWDGNGVWYGSR